MYTGKEKKAVSHYFSESFETIVAVLLDLRAGGKTGGCLSPVWVGVASRTRVYIVGILEPRFDGTGIKEMVVRVGLFREQGNQINVILACELMLTA